MNQFIVMCICKRKKKSLQLEQMPKFLTKWNVNILTQTFDKLSYFLQSLGGSSYRELTEKILDEKTRRNKLFFQVGLSGYLYNFFINFHLKRTFEPQGNLPGVLLETSKVYFWKKMTLFPSFTATVCTVYLFFLFYYHSIAIR